MDEDLEEQRERLLDGWERVAGGWGRQADHSQVAALPVSEWMLAHAAPAPGERVLELAAGPGDTGFMAARMIAPDGVLVCSDATAGMLAVARERAAEHGLSNVEFRQLQLEWIDLPAASVDVALCRWGVMLVIDPAAALRECRRVLKPGGRFALAVWDLPHENPWATLIQRVLVDLGHAEPAPQGGPGMFALSHPGLLEQMLADAGFVEVESDAVAIVRRYRNVTEWIAETLDHSGQFAAVWRTLDSSGRQRLSDRLSEVAAEYASPEGEIELPGSSLVGCAQA